MEGKEPEAQFHTVDEGWFEALRVPLVRGRTFEAQDDSTRPSVVVINEALARRYFADQDPIGRHIDIVTVAIGPLGQRIKPARDHQIIGVVRDVMNTSLASAPEPAVFFTFRQFPFLRMHLYVRGAGDAASLLRTLSAEVHRIDPTLPLADAQPLQHVLAAPADPPRLVMFVLAVFAGLALTLAAIGIYGILSWAVNHRRREIGIRLALGARPRAVLLMVLREGVWLGLGGAVLGVAGALAASRLLRTLLFGVKPGDPATLTAVFAGTLIVAVLACLVPGWRAAATEPARTLRSE